MSEPGETRSDADRVQCPRCGEWITDLWDYDWSHGGETKEIECEHCGSAIYLSCRVDVTYTARTARPATQEEV